MQDSPNFTPLSLATARQGVNYAPAKPIQDLLANKKLNKHPLKLEAGIRELYSHYLSHEKAAWNEMVGMAQLVSLFRKGQQLLLRRPFGAPGYYVRPLSESDDNTMRQTAMNLMGFFSQACESKVVASNPTVNIRPGDDTPEAIAAAQACRPLVDYYETEWYTDKFTRREAIRFLTDGMVIHQVRWNPYLGGFSIAEREVTRKDVTIDEGGAECLDCGTQGTPEQFQGQYAAQCPDCGSPAVDLRQPVTTSMAQIGMGQQRPVGAPELVSSSFMSWRWDLTKDLEESTWAIKRQYIGQGAINLMLGDVTVPDSQSSEQHGLDVLYALAYAGQAFAGQALRIDTPIATPTGWKEIWELGRGDTVFDEQGKPCNVLTNSGIAFGRPCYEVEFSDGSIIVADENHLWNTFTYNERAKFNNRKSGWRLHRFFRRAHLRVPNGGKRPDNGRRAFELLSDDLPEPTAKTRTTKQLLKTLTIGRKKTRLNHFIRVTEPLELPERALPLDSYQLGLWLGDGTAREGGLTSADGLEKAFAPLVVTKMGSSPYGFYIRGLKPILRGLNLLDNKHIPQEYLRASSSQRLALLQGLMDTDGSCTRVRGTCEFGNTNRRLIEGFLELTASLGIKTRVTYRPAHVMVAPNGKDYLGKESWRVGFVTDLPVFRLKRKLLQQKSSYRASSRWLTIVNIRPIESVPVCCITVDSPSHLYLAGRSMIPTHNSWSSQYRNTSLIDKKPTLAEFWLSPEDQALIECEESQTVTGQTLPAGKMNQWTQNQPACVVGLNDMSLIVGIYVKDSQRDEVVTAQWFMDADSGAGRGMEDTAAVQKRFNAVDGQIYQGLATTATPAVITDMSLLKEDQGRYLFAPGHNIDISLALLPPNMKLQDAFYVGAPGMVSQQYVQYGSQFLREMAQISSLVTEFTNGLIGVDNRTATGAQITAQLANSLYGPMLASKGQLRVDIARHLVCLIAAHDFGGRYYPGKGAAQGRMVSGQDLKGKVVFELEPHSELPSTPFSKQTDVRVLGEAFGGMLGAAQVQQMFPKFFRAVSKPFNVKFDTEDEDDVSTIMLKRLESMKGNLLAGVNDPSILVQMVSPPISKIEPKMNEKADWCSLWFDLEQGQSAPPELREAVEGLFWSFKNLGTQAQIPQALNQGMVQAAGMAPAAMGQAMLQPQPQQQQQQDNTDQIQSDERMQDQEHDHEMQLKSLEAQSQENVARIQGQNQIANTKLQGENQLKVERAKPKPRVKKTA